MPPSNRQPTLFDFFPANHATPSVTRTSTASSSSSASHAPATPASRTPAAAALAARTPPDSATRNLTATASCSSSASRAPATLAARNPAGSSTAATGSHSKKRYRPDSVPPEKRRRQTPIATRLHFATRWKEMQDSGMSIKKIAEEAQRDRKTVRQWIASLDDYRNAGKNRDIAYRKRVRIPSGRRKLKHPELDRALREAFDERRAAGLLVTVPSLLSAVPDIIAGLGIDHRGSRGYIKRWMKREKLTYRQRTHMAQKMPEDAPQEIAEFVEWLREQLGRYGLTLDAIINYDETPCWFDCPTTKTIDVKGLREIFGATTGNDKLRFTVILAARADGTKLKPAVIFKRKTVPKVPDAIASQVIIMAAEGGSMTTELMVNHYIPRVLVPGTASARLVLDSRQKPVFPVVIHDKHASHVAPATLDKFASSHLKPIALPGGSTSVLQPMDLSINKPFKQHMREEWNKFMLTNTERTTGGKLKKASYEVVCQWVITAWGKVSQAVIKRSFEAAGISLLANGSADNKMGHRLLKIMKAVANEDEEEVARVREEVNEALELEMTASDVEEEMYQRDLEVETPSDGSESDSGSEPGSGGDEDMESD